MDTSVKIIGEETFNKVAEQQDDLFIELYTTRHLGSAKLIHDFVEEYLHRRREKDELAESEVQSNVGSALNAIHEVSSANELTANV